MLRGAGLTRSLNDSQDLSVPLAVGHDQVMNVDVDPVE